MFFDNVKTLYAICTNSPIRIVLDLEKSFVKKPPAKIFIEKVSASPEEDYENYFVDKTFYLHRITKKQRAVFIPGKDIDSELYFDFYRQHLAESKICAYCGITGAVLEKEHILPKSHGFHMNKKNKVLACALCNRIKDDRCLGKWMVDEMHNPSISNEQWNNWFSWISNLIQYSGKFLNPAILQEWYSYFPPPMPLPMVAATDAADSSSPSSSSSSSSFSSSCSSTFSMDTLIAIDL
jgi:hypothetical protein